MTKTLKKISTVNTEFYGSLITIFMLSIAIPGLIMSAINTHERIVGSSTTTTTTTTTEVQFSNSGTSTVVGDFVHVDYAGALVKGFDLDAWKTLNLTGDVVPLAAGAYQQVGSNIYLLGGSINGYTTTTDSVFVLDLATNVMTNITTNGPNPGAWVGNPYSAVDVTNGLIYMYGGWNGITSASVDFSNSLYTFNTSTYTWTFIPAINDPGYRTNGGMIVYDNYLYLFGGVVENAFSANNQMFRLNLNNMTSWEVVVPANTPPSGRQGCVWQLFEGKGILFGGAGSGDNPTNDLWQFDFATFTWTQIQPSAGRFVQPGAVTNAQSAIVGNYMYLYAGKRRPIDTALSDDFWVLDIKQMLWRQLSNAVLLPLHRNYMGIVPDTLDVAIFGGFANIANNGNSAAFFRYNRPAKPIGVITSVTGTTTIVQTSGVVTNTNWNLVNGLAVFVEPSGNLTQVPSQPYENAVGTPISANSILLRY